ncbi:MAG: hypothetical protein K6E79_09415 [Pseudobutyrivibrio sp.]|nr:hypothetical protein [Pseudobutyrivibrio sp.]
MNRELRIVAQPIVTVEAEDDKNMLLIFIDEGEILSYIFVIGEEKLNKNKERKWLRKCSGNQVIRPAWWMGEMGG